MSCGSGNCGLWYGWAVLAGLALVGLQPRTVLAADIETRDFTVLVDNKLCGEVHMTIQRQDNGFTQVRCDTDITVTHLLGKYRYIYRGEETWKGTRLHRLSSSTNDNGKRFDVVATAEPGGLKVKVNDTEHMAREDVWLTSYWSLPDAKLRNAQLPLLDSDTGRDLDGRLQFVATEKRTVAGQNVSLNHYKLVGSKVNVDLWYDGSERLTRQEWIEQGHRTMMELQRIRR
jgi:Family of unknown function (DUF6134)